MELAEKYQVSVAQICIRFALQCGVLPLPPYHYTLVNYSPCHSFCKYSVLYVLMVFFPLHQLLLGLLLMLKLVVNLLLSLSIINELVIMFVLG